MNRACKVENELGIDTGQFHGRLKPSQKMLLIPVIPQWLNTFKLPAGKEFMLQLPENTPAHVVKNAALQLPKGSTLQLLDDICELPLPPNAALQLPKGSTLQLPKNSSLLLLKGDRLQLLDDFVLQLSENSSTPVLKSSTLRLPEDYTWHQLKNSKLLFSKTPMQASPDNSIPELFVQSLHLSAKSSVQLLDDPALYLQMTRLPTLPKNLIVELPNKRLLRTIAVNHDISAQLIYRTVLFGWLVTIPVIWLIVLIPIVYHRLIP